MNLQEIIAKSKVFDYIEQHIIKHHQIYRTIITAELWEEILSSSLHRVGMNNDWCNNHSHASGKDMTITDGEYKGLQLSCKSGVVSSCRKGYNTVKFSGYRTQKYTKLEDKIDYICQPHYDIHFLLSKSKSKDKNIVNYNIYSIDRKQLNYQDFDWKEGKNCYYMESPIFNAVILTNLSSQLWTTIREDSIIKHKNISVTLNNTFKTDNNDQ